MDPDDTKDKKDESSNIKTIPLGGVESMPQSIEVSKPVETTEEQKIRENIAFGEKAKEQATEKQNVVIPSQQTVQTPKPIIKEDKKEFPQVYGYKIPPQMQNNIKSVKSGVGKGDTNKGITWLKVFIDRLLKMG